MAFKKQDVLGNRQNHPLSFMPGSWCGDIVDLIAALGGVPDNMDHRIVQDNKVIFTPTQDGYKRAIQTLHQWYQEGLIDRNPFQDDKAYLAKGKAATENLGSAWWEVPEMVGADRANDYALVPALKGVDGKRIASQSTTRKSPAAPSPSPGPTNTPPRPCAGPTTSTTPSSPPRPTGDRSAKPSKRPPMGC